MPRKAIYVVKKGPFTYHDERYERGDAIELGNSPRDKQMVNAGIVAEPGPKTVMPKQPIARTVATVLEEAVEEIKPKRRRKRGNK